MYWTDKQVSLLLTLWNEGKNPSQIAARLSALGHETVLEKVQLMRLKRPVKRTASARIKSNIQACIVSALQHSPRYKSATTGEARRQVERRAVKPVRMAIGTGSASSADGRHAKYLAVLMELDGDLLNPCQDDFGSYQRSRTSQSKRCVPA